jgi:hypothetical protein
MPAWVQLDCCTVPSAMIGVALSRDEAPAPLVQSLEDKAVELFGAAVTSSVSSCPWIPVSEYCAVPTWTPGTVVGLSLYSLIPRAGLGVRTKALALSCYGASRQVGLTQYGNSAVRTHAHFGPLRIQVAHAAVHTREDSFVYEVDLDPARLERLARGEQEADALESTFEVPIARGVAQRIQELIAQEGPLEIVAPGHRVSGDEQTLLLRRQSEAP